MLFWAPSGRAWMATDEQRACTHCNRSMRKLHPVGPQNCVCARDPRPATQRPPPRQVLVLASSCVRSGLGCRSIKTGSWLRGLSLGHSKATFRNEEIDEPSCSLRVAWTWKNVGGPMPCELGGP